MSGRKIWDLPVRISHWAMVLLVLGLWGTGEWGWFSMQWHFYFGYTLLTVVLFRILWGFFGSEHARFGDFLRGPRATWQYARAFIARRATESPGHNPLGAWSVLALLGLLLAQAGTGLFSSDDIAWFGPLSDRVSAATSRDLTGWHHFGKDLLLILIGLHVLAVLLHYLWRREDLITPMFTGQKPIPGPDAVPAPWWRAVILLLLAAGVVYGVSSL